MPNTLETTTARCNSVGCDHPEDEDLIRCESCHGQICKPHSKAHDGYSLCDACAEKEYAALRTARMQVKEIGGCRRGGWQAMAGWEFAAELREIANSVENWDVPEVPK